MDISNLAKNFVSGTRWNTDHKIRIVRKKGEISELENKIHWKKIELAETTLDQNKKNNLTDISEIVKLCMELEEQNNLLDLERKALEKIREEKFLRIPPDENKVIQAPKIPEQVKNTISKIDTERIVEEFKKPSILKPGLISAIAFGIIGAVIHLQSNHYFYSALIEQLTGGTRDRNYLVSNGMPSFLITISLMAIAGFFIGVIFNRFQKR